MVNRLSEATSPYLVQHANNPVDWWEWSPEAFAEARQRDVPILLSIGYAACHWCHVMAHESFENPEIADIMNANFVCIKVDREERPDIDALYMEATQAMTGSGGWPMTVFATPDAKPFFCGTYFPPRTMQGRVGFPELCETLAAAWEDQRDDIFQRAEQLTEHLNAQTFDAGDLPTIADIDNAVANLVALFDPTWGGFSSAPKFPQPMVINVLLRAFDRSGDEAALQAAVTTLDAMAAGGMYDHLGGGFARYSTDKTWLVPHFEKMLSDQALLVQAYSHAYSLVGLERHRRIVTETIEYVLRDLRHTDGGFYSSEDADADGLEGSFSVWSPDEIRSVLADDPEAAEAAIAWWGVTDEGNFEGQSILHRMHDRTGPERPEAVARARAALFVAREKRVRPGLDNKVLTEWNALMISALCDAAMALDRPDWIVEAVRSAAFLTKNLHDDTRGWLRSWQQDGGAKQLAFAADYATLTDAFTKIYETTGDQRWLDEATATADALIARFADPENGGFFTTAHDGETLIARQKALQDNPTPSANSAAAVALLRLGAMTGALAYRVHAEGVLRLAGRFAGQHPTAFGHLLAAIELHDLSITEVTVRGDFDAPEAAAFRAVYWSAWRPRGVLIHTADDAATTAQVCRDAVCDLPVHDPTALADALDL